MLIEIKNRWTGTTLFSHDVEPNSLRITALAALATGANLTGANLTSVRDDIWAILSSVPGEVAGLIEAIKTGRVDGSTYTGECACLVGTVAKVRGIHYDRIESLAPDSSLPAERFFMGICKGDTPETSQFSALALQWSQEWLDRMRAAFPPAPAVAASIAE